MSPELLHILLATAAAGALSVSAAAVLSLTLLSRIVPRLVSLSAGLLLGTAVLHLLPEAVVADIRRNGSVEADAVTFKMRQRMVGDFLNYVSASAAVFTVVAEDKWLAVAFIVVGAAGKAITNAFTLEP